jgi:hypothetical protein
LVDLKQIDKIIEILSEIEDDYIYIVVGLGTREYKNYLYDKSKNF